MSLHFSGPALRHARLAAGMTPERLAAGIGRSVWSIQSYELGRALPSLSALTRLADLLEVGIGDFFVHSSCSCQEVRTP